MLDDKLIRGLLLRTAAHDGWLPAVIYVTELMGNETLCFLRLGDEKLIARAPADFRAEIETPAWAWLDLDKADFFDADSGAALR